MSDVATRPRRPEDLYRCVEVLREVHHADSYPLNWPADPHRWLSPPGIRGAWVAEDIGGDVVGHVLVLEEPTATKLPVATVVRAPATTPTAEVSRLFVAPAARHRSMATRLLHEVRRWATGQGRGLVLHVTERSAASGFYERNGWTYTGTTRADWTAPDGGAVHLRHYVAT